MRFSLKNIAITLGIAAVITTKNVKKPSILFAKSDTKEENLKFTQIDNSEEQEEDILYV